MLNKYAFWIWKDGSQGQINQIIGDEKIPKFSSGKPMFSEEEADLAYIIQAETFEEAMAIHNLRQGYSPYRPMGNPVECPDCGNYYYLGSGRCFCGYNHDKARDSKAT